MRAPNRSEKLDLPALGRPILFTIQFNLMRASFFRFCGILIGYVYVYCYCVNYWRFIWDGLWAHLCGNLSSEPFKLERLKCDRSEMKKSCSRYQHFHIVHAQSCSSVQFFFSATLHPKRRLKS